MTYMYPPWAYPEERYYYQWYGPQVLPPVKPTDSDIKSTVVERLRVNPHTRDDDITVA